MFLVYKIKNISNDKIYIGKTSQEANVRWEEHIKSSYTSKNNPAYNTYFHRAIRKYGRDSFNIKIIYQTDNEANVNIMEENYIRWSNSHCRFGNGYNMTFGGEGTKGIYRSSNTRLKMSIAQLGKKHSPQQKEIHMKSMLEFGDKIAKDWIITDLDNNEFLIHNLRRFCIDHNLDQGNMMKVVNGKSSHCKGYRCRKVLSKKGQEN